MSASEIFAEPEFKSRYLYSISSEEEITECKKTFKDSQRESCVWGTVYIVPKKGDLKPLDFLAGYHGYVACKYYLVSVHKLAVSKKVVIPAKAGFQFFQEVLDAPASSTGQAPQVRHDGITEFINRHIISP